MNRILATAGKEFRIALRNRWVFNSIAMKKLFSLVLSAAGPSATGMIGASRLSVVVGKLAAYLAVQTLAVAAG